MTDMKNHDIEQADLVAVVHTDMDTAWFVGDRDFTGEASDYNTVLCGGTSFKDIVKGDWSVYVLDDEGTLEIALIAEGGSQSWPVDFVVEFDSASRVVATAFTSDVTMEYGADDGAMVYIDGEKSVYGVPAVERVEIFENKDPFGAVDGIAFRFCED